jgi:hypothetical protein
LPAGRSVKALQKANAQGQRIYHITAENMAAALPNIRHDTDTMAEIRSALAVGKEVVTHTEAVSVPGWSGAGYAIVDPETGVGAWKIGGGRNGAWLSGFTLGASVGLLLLAILAGASIGAFTSGVLLFAVQVIVPVLLVFSFWLSMQSEEYKSCFLGGLVTGFTLVTTLGTLPNFLARLLSVFGLTMSNLDKAGSSARTCDVL